MADGGGPPAPLRPPACPPEWKAFFGCLVTLMRETDAKGAASAAELAHVRAEMELLKRLHSQRLAIAKDSIQEIRRGAVVKEEAVKLLEPKEPAAGEPDVDELEDNYMECVRSLSTLLDENTKLKNKLKEVENQAEFAENDVDHQHSAKDLKEELRKLKQAYKTLVSDKDKEICAIRAERCFVWNQYKELEQEFRNACNSKNIEISRAHAAAKELEKTVNELRLEVQVKDVEIGRLQEEAVRAKEEMLMMKMDLEQMRSLVNNKDEETDQPETSRKQKKGLEVKNGKSKVEGPVSGEKSRILHATPIRMEEKTCKKHVSWAKGTRDRSGKNSCMSNTKERGKSETSQKRKRGSSISSHGHRRCSPKQVRPATASPSLFSPRFNVPKLTSPSPLKL